MSAPAREPVLATPGCRLHAWNAEAMRTLATRAGVGNAVVASTCAVTHDTVRRARQEVRGLRREHPGARIVVTGCAAQVEPETFAAMPEVSLVLGNPGKLRPGARARLAPGLVSDAERVVVDDIMSVRETASHLIDGFGARARHLARQVGRTHAVLVEGDRPGRTGQFAEPRPAGRLVTAAIRGQDGGRLPA